MRDYTFYHNLAQKPAETFCHATKKHNFADTKDFILLNLITLRRMNISQIMASLEAKHPGESEYLQAVKEVLLSIEPVYNQHPEFEKAKIIERLVEPDRIFTFRVTWVDDKGEVQTNLGYRVQFNNAIGPYKGGMLNTLLLQVH